MKKAGVICLCLLLCATLSRDAPRPASAAARKKILTMMIPYENEGERGSLIQLADEFTRGDPTASIELAFAPREDYWKHIYLDYSRQSLADLVVMGNTMLPAFHKLGVLQDLGPYLDASGLREAIPAKLLKNASLDGTAYGIPYSCETYGLYCNMDLLRKHGCAVPESWEQLVVVCGQLLREPADSLGIAAAPGEALACHFLQLMYSADASLRNLKGDGARAAFQLISDLVDGRMIAKACVNWNQTDLTRKFAGREIAMMINSSSQTRILEGMRPEFDWKVSGVPIFAQEKFIFSGESITATDPDSLLEAYPFLDFVTSAQAVSTRIGQGGSLPVRSGAENALLSAGGPYGVFAGQLETAQPMPSIVLWQNVSQTLQDTLMGIFSGEKTVDQAAQESYTLVNAYIIEG